MKFLDLTLSSPQDNLACDEALLDWCEDGYGHEILRFWESPQYFVALGYSNKICSEVNLRSCRRYQIPVLRRSSGGGTVLQGPGCLSYALILKIHDSGPLQKIRETNSLVMELHREALKKLTGAEIVRQGTTDLALGVLKFSGNAQRRKHRFLLFHGTFLLNLDISMVDRTLPLPSTQPPYRQGRPHNEFLINLKVSPQRIKNALQESWRAFDMLQDTPLKRIEWLVKNKYSTDKWNFKF
jgi:lipoate-protein ligase A